jgi:hypothetical protein
MMSRFLVMMGICVMVGCGASNEEIRSAKLAVYRAPIDNVFEAAIQTAQEGYSLGGIDAPNHRFATSPQFYSEEGMRLTAGAGDVVQNVRGNSILMHLVVEVFRADGGVSVVVTPRTFQIISWSPKPRELSPNDANFPGFVKGRVDALTLAIYQRLQSTAR